MVAASFNLFRFTGDLLHVVSIVLLWMKIQKTRSCAGLSLKSQLLFMLVYATRYLDLFYLHHFDLPHAYNFLMKCLFLGTQATLLHYCWYRYRATYNAKVDTLRIEFILAPCAFLAFFFIEHNAHGGVIYFIREVYYMLQDNGLPFTDV